MQRILNGLNLAARQKDLLLVAVFVTILTMIILPLPPWAMDLMITLNISASIMIILMSLQLHNPVHFSTFPSVLLVTTLFRLAISISTTRLILIEGDAGAIVETFGSVVVGGNLVVGLVIFLIITVVQFLVITKGADRVAEVGARFTLDGMPGKQMSVDADVRAGTLDHVGAKEARSLLERETKLFGAMDGAMKFVKGDAIAGLVITAINLIGGIAIGMSQLEYSFSDALGLYAILTIGDGLVAQIPALLISVSAGTMVTRVTNPKGIDLGSEIAEQVSANHRMLTIAGVVIAGFGFIPGFPTVIFLAIGLTMAGGILLYKRRTIRAEAEGRNDWQALIQKNEETLAEAFRRKGEMPTLSLILPPSVCTLPPDQFMDALTETRVSMEQVYGVPLGRWQFTFGPEGKNDFLVLYEGDVLSRIEVRPDCFFVRCNLSYLQLLDIPCVQHFGPRQGVLVHESQAPRLLEENIVHWRPITSIMMETKRVIVENLDLFLGIQPTSQLLDELARSQPSLISDLKETLTINQISSAFRLLVQEKIPLLSHRQVCEAILEWAPKRPDPQQILQQIRIAIGDRITRRFISDGFLPAVIIAPSLESLIREGFRTASEQSYLVIDSQISQKIVQQIKPLAPKSFERGRDPVIVTQQDIRRSIHNLMQEHGIYIPVVAYQELNPETVVYPMEFVTAEGHDLHTDTDTKAEFGAA